MYTLASASILAIRLVQHPAGAQLADLIDRVLVLTDDELQALSPYDAKRPLDLPDELLAVLEALCRESPLVGAPTAAVETALDAVTGCWLDRPALRAHWDRVLSPVPVALPETSYAEQLRLLLEDVVSRQHWGGVTRAHAVGRGRLAWSNRMHEACLAAHRAGRVREIARAQLAAARALSLSTAAQHLDVQGIAMEVTAAVQALCTADLLDTSSLRHAWVSGT